MVLADDISDSIALPLAKSFSVILSTHAAKPQHLAHCLMNTSRSVPVAQPQVSAPPAALHFRLLALLYDAMPLAALWFATAALGLLLRGGQPVIPNTSAAWLEFGAMLLTSFGYLGISWRRGGQTLGMRAWRLRLVDRDGFGAGSWGQLAIRFVVAIFSLLAFGLGFAWSLLDRERRTWHDLASGTVLVRLPKPAKQRRHDRSMRT